MKFTVDYHFHPNLPRNEERAIRKCKLWWRALKEHHINTVVVTEHVYRNPQRAYQLMKKTKPRTSFVFPGMEYLTQEGADIIIFDQTPKIYSLAQLQPYRMTLEQTIVFVKLQGLAAFVPHPYTPGATSIIKKKGEVFYHQATDFLGAIEITNTCFTDVEKILSKLPKKVLARKRTQMEKVNNLPKQDYPHQIKFLAAGSDAHHREALGVHIAITCPPEKLYRSIISNTNPHLVIPPIEKTHYWLVCKESITSIHEFLIKNVVRVKQRVRGNNDFPE
ncbi:hypothetical protein HYW21_08450 [Candidatus Woesearchaeota archaeon]|nr:hypothetical protein [Candidatus Woesearchaeota archaeon]